MIAGGKSDGDSLRRAELSENVSVRRVVVYLYIVILEFLEVSCGFAIFLNFLTRKRETRLGRAVMTISLPCARQCDMLRSLESARKF